MRIFIFLYLLAISACSVFDRNNDNNGENMTLEKLYKEAKNALDSKNYTRAVEYYEWLETRYPFGVYGQQSLLALAYAYYKTNKHNEAIFACDRFIRLYPQNSHVDYAYYLRGLVNFNHGKRFMNRVFSFDSSQRDIGFALQSFQDFSKLAKRFPDSEYMGDVQKRMIYLRNLFAQHELHVATYYLRRGAFVAAANRARYVIENYARTPSAPDALVIMAKSYKILEMNELSDDAIRVLKLNYPGHRGIGKVADIMVK